MTGALGRAVVTVFAAGAAVALLLRAGAGALAAPSAWSWGAVDSWYDTVGPQVAAMVALRLVVLPIAVWLLLATTLQVLRAIPGLQPLGALADLVSPRSLQRLGHTLAGLSLTAGLAAPVPSAGIPVGPPLPPAPPAVPVEVVVPTGTATMRLVSDASVPADEAAASPEPLPAGEVTVEAGDSLWSLAADELTAARGGSPSEREVFEYWRRVIEANRSRLLDPANADLIYPGQVLVLPPP